MKVSGPVLGLVAGGVAVAGIVIATVVRAQPAQAAPSGRAAGSVAPWTLKQGHRYQVTLRAPAGSDWKDTSPQHLPAGLVYVREVGRTGFTLTYQIDSTAPDHDEPVASFYLGSQAPELDVVVADMGPSSSQPPTGGGPSPTTTPAPTPAGAGGAAWLPAQTAAMGERVRFSMTAADVQSFATAQHIGVPANATPGELRHLLETLLGAGNGGARLQTRVFFVWAPGNTPPADWPADDKTVGTGYQVEMVYGIGYAVAALATGNLSAPSLTPGELVGLGATVQGFWKLSGSGPTSRTLSGQPAVTWPVQPKLSIGSHARIANVNPAAAVVNQAFAPFGDAMRLTWYAYAHAIALAFGGVPVLAWAPGETLPPDWPSDDPNPGAEAHLEMRSGISHDFSTDSNLRVWVAQGPGA